MARRPAVAAAFLLLALGCTRRDPATVDAGPPAVPTPPVVPPPRCALPQPHVPAILAKLPERVVALAVDAPSVYVATASAIWTVPAAGGAARKLAEGFAPMKVRSLAARSHGLWVGLGAEFDNGYLGAIASVDPETGKLTYIDKNTRPVDAIVADDTDVYWLREESIHYYGDDSYWRQVYPTDPGSSLLTLPRSGAARPRVLVDRETGRASGLALAPGAIYRINGTAESGNVHGSLYRYPLPFDAKKRDTLLVKTTLEKLSEAGPDPGFWADFLDGEMAADGAHVWLLVHSNHEAQLWWEGSDGGAPGPFEQAAIDGVLNAFEAPHQALALDATRVWWLDWIHGVLLRREKDRACPAVVLAAELRSPGGLVVADGAAYLAQGTDEGEVLRIDAP